jgi:mannose/fructose-specific phosphotransferase system component IIA
MNGCRLPCDPYVNIWKKIMSDVRGIVIGHGNMAAGVVDAVRQITGLEEDALQSLSNRGLGPDTLIDSVRALLVPGVSTILFTDLQSGSCAMAARRLTAQLPDTAVICGANLPLLLEFAMSRSEPIDVLVDKLVERGRSSIVSATPPAKPDASKE